MGVLISSDLDWDSQFKDRLIEQERECRAIYRRPAYQYTELEEKINADSQAYYNGCNLQSDV